MTEFFDSISFNLSEDGSSHHENKICCTREIELETDKVIFISYSSSSYENHSGLSGFAKDINEIVEISKSIRELIDSKDEDGVCHYSYNDEVSAARNVQGKLDTLMRYDSRCGCNSEAI